MNNLLRFRSNKSSEKLQETTNVKIKSTTNGDYMFMINTQTGQGYMKLFYLLLFSLAKKKIHNKIRTSGSTYLGEISCFLSGQLLERILIIKKKQLFLQKKIVPNKKLYSIWIYLRPQFYTQLHTRKGNGCFCIDIIISLTQQWSTYQGTPGHPEHLPMFLLPHKEQHVHQ